MPSLISPERLLQAGTGYADDYRGQCLRCGICTVRCPTWQLLGDERDSPRGRVAMAMDVLETATPASPETVRHLDRCLSCLACSSACPFGVDHTHLWDRARTRIEETQRRAIGDRMLRAVLGVVLVRPWLLRPMLRAARLVRPLGRLLPGRLEGLVARAPGRLAPMEALPRWQPAVGPRRLRVALMTGCAQRVLRPEINAATVRLLSRHGCEVVTAPGAGCCGALVLHMGRPAAARRMARANVAAWERLAADGGLDAIVINTSGCGPTVKDYAALLADDGDWAARGARIGALTRDVCEVLDEIGLKAPAGGAGARVACHVPCSLEHGQGIARTPARLLGAAGFEVIASSAGEACCGSAGTYSLLQPEIADALGAARAAALEESGAEVIASANIGCQEHLAAFTEVPVVHAVELLDWATGGPRPRGLGSS